MVSLKLASLATLLSTLTLVSGDCILHNQLSWNDVFSGSKETREELCVPQAEGNYQISLEVSEVSVPTFDGDNALAGVVGNDVFVVYTHDCYPISVFSRSAEGNDCGVPYTLNDIFGEGLTITKVYFGVGDPFFAFDLEGETYSVNDDKCGGCGDLSHGLTADQACRCGFPWG